MTPPEELRAVADVRPNWREIDIVDLTDAEVALMTPEEDRWCGDLLVKRHLAKTAPAVEALEVVEPAAPTAIEEPILLDPNSTGGIAIMAGGARVLIYPGESDSDDAFCGELLDPTPREMLGGAHISCLWDRAQVVHIEPSRSLAAASGEL